MHPREHRRRGRTAWLRALLLLSALVAPPAMAEVEWIERDGAASRVVLHYFWSPACPHCQAARPYIEHLAQEYDWLLVKDHDVVSDAENRRLLRALAAEIGQEARGVPTFVFCGEMVTGFDDAEGVGAFLTGRLVECRQRVSTGLGPVSLVDSPRRVYLPLIGGVDLDVWSLPTLTIVLAALDSFNPCAMFVLLFLMTLLVHAKSRARMLLVGGTFVAVSGLAYFAFMAAWLNLFLILGQLAWITSAAGLLAVAIGVVNVKDYVVPARGVSLSIPETAKPGLFARMRRLVASDRIAPLVGGTLVLAVVANAYELLCTAGLPMVFTRALTLHELPTSDYYLYLVVYNLVYVVPLFLIVVLFVVSLGGRKLSELEGRTLKLLSGLMMLGLGGVLLLAPELLSNVSVALALIAGALGVTALVRRLSPPRQA